MVILNGALAKLKDLGDSRFANLVHLPMDGSVRPDASKIFSLVIPDLIGNPEKNKNSFFFFCTDSPIKLENDRQK